MFYRRNADEDIRRLGRHPESPVDQARHLVSQLRAAQISELQIRLAARLGHPAALILYPEEEPSKFDAVGMVVICGGAWQTGNDFQTMIEELPFAEQQIYIGSIADTVSDEMAAIIERMYRPQSENRNRLFELLKPLRSALVSIRQIVNDLSENVIIDPARYEVHDNDSECDACGRVTSTAIIDMREGWPTIECQLCAFETKLRRALEATRLREAETTGAPSRWNLIRMDGTPVDPVAYHLARTMGAILRASGGFMEVANAQINLEASRAERLRESLGPQAIFRELCRLYTTMGWDFEALMIKIGENLLQLEL